jgi:hypothetical protein
VGAVRGIIDSTLALVVDGGVTHLGAATDTVIESFRNDMFAGYKTGEGIEPALWAQFPLAERALRAIGVTVWGMVEFEADDALATAAARWKTMSSRCHPHPGQGSDAVRRREPGRHVQPSGGEAVHRGGRAEKFGVYPHSIPDYLALVGDTADGVPGLPGWGAKSSAGGAVRVRPPRVDPRRRGRVDGDGAGCGQARRHPRRASGRRDAVPDADDLRRDVPLAEELDDLRWRGVVMDEFEPLCRELGFESILERDLPTA